MMKNKKERFKKTKNYKAEIAIGIAFLFIFGAIGVVSVTRTITDSSDTIDTYIRNSKGNYWDATGANIQVAIWDLNSTNGGIVTLPASNLTITVELSMEDNVALIGQGEGKTLIYSNQGSTFIPIWIYNDDYVILRDFTLDMNDNGGNSIYVGNSDYVTIDHVEILRTGYQGIYIAPSGTKHSFFTNIRVKHGLGVAGHGIGVNNANNSVFANIIVENYDTDSDIAEDGLDITDCYNSTFDNIIVQGCGWHDGIKLAASGPALSNCTFSNIVISDAQGYGMKIQNVEYSSFNNIVLRDTGYISIGGGSALVHHCNFNNIIVSNSDGIGFYVGGSNLTFNNLQILNPTTGGIRMEESASDLSFNNLHVMNAGSFNKITAGCSRILISNSIFSDGANMGLSIDGTSHFKIINCIFKDNVGDAIDTTITPCNNYSIIGCTFEGNALAIDTTATDNYYIIMGNICSDGDNIDADVDATRIVDHNIATVV